MRGEERNVNERAMNTGRGIKIVTGVSAILWGSKGELLEGHK